MRLERGVLLRKIVHFWLILGLALPLYSKGILSAFLPPSIIAYLGRWIEPGELYALMVAGAATVNAFQVRRPIRPQRLAEIRRKASETLPMGKRLNSIMGSIEKTIEAMEREYEKRAGYFGLTSGVIGVTAGYLMFGRNVIYGIGAMATTDVLSSLIGMGYGSRRLPYTDGTLEGTIAGFFAFLVPLLFVEPGWKALLIAAGSSLVELYGIEDNLSLPILVSGLTWLLGFL